MQGRINSLPSVTRIKESIPTSVLIGRRQELGYAAKYNELLFVPLNNAMISASRTLGSVNIDGSTPYPMVHGSTGKDEKVRVKWSMHLGVQVVDAILRKGCVESKDKRTARSTFAASLATSNMPL
ncbi:MAG: hypothetical protein KA941_11835, partial [Flavobacteriales bacterium]|nr:hypothetical protein [Flavobacteriales bacterium]